MILEKKKAVRKVKMLRIDPIGPLMNPILTKEGHLAPFEVPPKWHRRAFLGSKLVRSEIHKADLERLRNEYYVPDNIRITILDLDDRVVFPSSRCVVFFEDAFDTSMQFPLHPFIANNLNFYLVISIQFSLNGFRVRISFILICDMCRIKLRCSLF